MLWSVQRWGGQTFFKQKPPIEWVDPKSGLVYSVNLKKKHKEEDNSITLSSICMSGPGDDISLKFTDECHLPLE